MLIQIEHRRTKEVLFELDKEGNSIRLTLEAAIKANANLEEANLYNANLEEANLKDANLEEANL